MLVSRFPTTLCLSSSTVVYTEKLPKNFNFGMNSTRLPNAVGVLKLIKISAGVISGKAEMSSTSSYDISISLMKFEMNNFLLKGEILIFFNLPQVHSRKAAPRIHGTNRIALLSRVNVMAAPAPKPQIQTDVKMNLQKNVRSEVIVLLSLHNG